MEFSISHSSLRLPTVFSHQRCIKATSHGNNGFLSIKTISNPQTLLENAPPINSSFRWGYMAKTVSQSLAYVKDKHNTIQASAQAQPIDSESTLAKVSRFGSASIKFLRPYAMGHTVVSGISLYARVFVENPQIVFKWSMVLKAFPGLLAMVLALAYYIGVNQIFDADIDRVNKPYLPIPSGELSSKQAWFLVMLDLLGGLLILRFMNADLITTSIYCAWLFLGTFYSAPPLRFKGSIFQTSIVNPLMAGILHNIGVIYASTTSLGLPFNLWSPSVIFIVVFITLYFIVITNLKDLTDVDGDAKHNIRTLPAIYGPRKTTFFFAGILLANYVGAMVVAMCMPQVFKPHIMVPTHAIAGALTFFQVWKLDKANYDKEECEDFYRFIWKVLCLEFVFYPFI